MGRKQAVTSALDRGDWLILCLGEELAVFIGMEAG